MCDAPYDYCGPTFLARPGEECVSDARMNSAFTPSMPYVAGQPVEVVEGVVDETMLESSPSDVPRLQPEAGARPDLQPQSPAAPTPAPQGSDPTTTQTQRDRPVSLRR